MIELLRDRDGVAWFMELNGRTWGSLALARRLGLEYPAWAALDALGIAAPPSGDVRIPNGQRESSAATSGARSCTCSACCAGRALRR